MMDIADLMAQGGFVDPNPIKKEVVWSKKDKATGESADVKFDIYVKAQSWGVMETLWTGDGDNSKTAKYICNSVLLGPKMDQSFTYEQAFNLDPNLATALLKAINEVNGKTKESAKN